MNNHVLFISNESVSVMKSGKFPNIICIKVYSLKQISYFWKLTDEDMVSGNLYMVYEEPINLFLLRCSWSDKGWGRV